MRMYRHTQHIASVRRSVVPCNVRAAGSSARCPAARRCRSLGAVVWLVALAVVGMQQPSAAQSDAQPAPNTSVSRLYERLPFDVIVVDDRDKTEVEVEPIQVEGSLDPAKHEANEKLIVRLIKFPEQEYEIRWGDIAEIRRFEQVLLAKANELVADQRFDEAFDYFNYLQIHFPHLEGLSQSIDRYLFAEAKALLDRGRRQQARVPLLALYDRQPDFPGLREIFEGLFAEQVDALMQQARYSEVRARLSQLSRLYPQSELVAKYQSQLQAIGTRLIEEARRHLEQSQWREARTAAHRAMAVWEGNAEARQVWAEAYRRYPLINVAVRQLSTHAAWRLDDWAARRVLRLVERSLFERVGYGEEGTRYHCPLGTVETERLGMRLSIQLRRDLQWAPGIPFTGLDVSRQLLSAGEQAVAGRAPNAGDALPQPVAEAWQPSSAWIDAVGVDNVFGVTIDWRRRPLRPEALLQTVIHPLRYRSAARRGSMGLGPYTLGSTTDDVVHFIRREHYFAAQAGQAREIVEKRYNDTEAAISALRGGEVMLVDRVPPWLSTAHADDKQLAIGAYAAPTVHCLAIEGDDPRLADRSFRRAIVYALRRQRILQDSLLRGAEIAGCQVLSGPLPTGYAYDPNIEPREYDPLLAYTLVAIANRRAAATDANDGARPSSDDKNQPSGETPPKNVASDDAARNKPGATPPADSKEAATPTGPPESAVAAVGDDLVLAHPPSDVARLACRLIREQLAAVGIRVVLREISGLEKKPIRCDLRYVELMLSEPIVDVPRLLADARWAPGPGTAYLRLALRKLRHASDWNEARAQLREIHRILHDDLRFIPLWQLTEFFAYRRDLTGIGSRPMTIYDQVESWQSEWVELAKHP